VLLLGWEQGVKPFVTSILDSLGLSSRSAYDVRQLWELVEEHPGRWSYIVVDLDAISRAEIDALTKLLAEISELSVVGAASAPKEWSELVARLGRLEVVEKPIGVWSVERAIGRLKMRAAQR
jgi:DNA-binding NtrC family response regulator